MKLRSLFRITGIIFIGVILLSAACATPSPKPKTYSAPPPMTIDVNKQYTATIETDKGNLVLELFAKDVPVTVNNFVFLAREGFYDDTTFHRVIADFMAQGGDPTGTGRGNAGYTFPDEFTEHTMLLERYQWLILAPILIAASFSLPIPHSTALMVNTLSLVS